MINLLPPEEKEKLYLEMIKREVIILWLLVLFFLSCLILILFSVRIYSQSQIESQKVLLLAAKKELEQSEIQELQGKVSSSNLILGELSNFYQQKVYFSEIIEKISEPIPQEIYLTNLSIVFLPARKIKEEEKEKIEEAKIKISLSGFAPARESLFEFKQNLEKEPRFKEISFPSANWVKPLDIDFSVSFTIK